MLKRGFQFAPGYCLQEFLGRGQFGQVWRATAPGGAATAVKFIDLSDGQGHKEYEGVKRLKQIRHANLMPITAIWLLDEQGRIIEPKDAIEPSVAGGEGHAVAATNKEPSWLVFTMLLGGMSLQQRLRDCIKSGHVGIPPKELLSYMDEASKGIDFLNSPQHDLGDGPIAIQHSDIKPANIVLIGNSAVVCDFGLARVLTRNQVTATSAAGTPAYMSPEAISGEPSRNSDQYSLAVTYYHLRTGTLPVNDGSLWEVLDAHRQGKLEFGLVPEAEQEVLKKTTDLNWEQRFDSSTEMVDAFREALRAEGHTKPSFVPPSLAGMKTPKPTRQGHGDPTATIDLTATEAMPALHGTEDSTKKEGFLKETLPELAEKPASTQKDSKKKPLATPLEVITGERRSRIDEVIAHPLDAGPIPSMDENVQFTIYRPKKVRPRRWYRLLAFVHLDELPADAEPDEIDLIERVKQEAKRVLGKQIDQYQKTGQESYHAVPKGAEITFVPKVEGCEFNPAQHSIRWLESVHKTEFSMFANASLDGTSARGRMSVFLGSILLAEIPLRFKVDSAHVDHVVNQPTDATTAAPYRKIFASYSHQDTKIVEQFERYAATLGDRYLRDCKDLRSGEDWDARILELIEDADVFQLFWSQHSMRSSYVRREWEHAISLTHKGPNFIRPTYWEVPLPSDDENDLPPAELQRRHFTCLQLSRSSDTPSSEGVEQARQQQKELANQLSESYAILDIKLGRKLRSEWGALARIAPREDDDPLKELVQPALDWLKEVDRQSQEDADFQATVDALEEAMDTDASQQELERLFHKLQGFDRELSPAITMRLQERLRALTEKSERRNKLLFVTIAAFLILIVVLITMLRNFLA